VIALALLAAAATGYGSLNFDVNSGLPPLRYWHDTRAVVSFMTHQEIVEHCPKIPDLVSCADIGGPGIWIDNPCLYLGESYARKLCHELAHRNGWGADHPR
jgi:hypothetical protein